MYAYRGIEANLAQPWLKLDSLIANVKENV